MPRGKYVNHKGRSREFTPADVLQQEPDRIRQGERSSGVPIKNQAKVNFEDKCMRSQGAHSLIEISNPNRLPRRKPLSLLITNTNGNQFTEEDDATQRRRRERRRERMQGENIQRSKETLADLARLALVRREREAAAQQRLAAKKAAAEAAASSSDTSLKKISQKPSEDAPPELQSQESQSRNLRAHQRKTRSPRKK
ncbi:28 kDa heat- and acid-stable phosphoprotein-like [Drosophila teissieri]|uniref:28 kDa heat- and acid-stable phosphoprotein-like n=1 Tax=Drosophila teissieri TaxID=7243 RepID=UPI001CBA5A13|nr:28 kDa heat- and acid-stable phosphoprotein-like [Drosophila teissieri]XP_043660300.1 28 kDa heat- and acid-stable phosphoprotein-like [Drosophila teissieri]